VFKLLHNVYHDREKDCKEGKNRDLVRQWLITNSKSQSGNDQTKKKNDNYRVFRIATKIVQCYDQT
jgi:hypothetical protein